MKTPNPIEYNNAYLQSIESKAVQFCWILWWISTNDLIFRSVQCDRRKKLRNKSDVIHNNNDTSMLFVEGSETKSIYNTLNYDSEPQNRNWGFEMKLTFGMFNVYFDLIEETTQHITTPHNIRFRGLVLKLKSGNYKLQAQSPMMRMWWVTH